MKFETFPEDFKEFRFVCDPFPSRHNKVYYVTKVEKYIFNKVLVSWYDDNIEKQGIEYLLSEVEDNLARGVWRKLD